jgi:hypothetical protein
VVFAHAEQCVSQHTAADHNRRSKTLEMIEKRVDDDRVEVSVARHVNDTRLDVVEMLQYDRQLYCSTIVVSSEMRVF